MKITPSSDENGRKVLHVEADWVELAADYDDIVAAYAQEQIPGFRQGKVPKSVIEQRLQKQILDDLAQRAAHRLGRDALSESGAEALGPLEIGDMECSKGKPIRFSARFWPMPEIVLPGPGALAAHDDGSGLRDQISHRLLELVIFTVPDDVVRAELDEDEDEHDQEAWKAASDRVRLMLILKRIAHQEGIEVSERDVEDRIRQKAKEFNMDPGGLSAELEKGGGRQRLKDMLLAESTLEYLEEQSTQTKGGTV